MKVSRKKLLPGLILVWAAALAIYFVFPVLEQKLLAQPPHLFDYMTWQTEAAHNWSYRILWIIGDLSEGTVHKALFASVGVVLGGCIAHYLYKKNSPKMGNPICANLGIFPQVVLASFVGLFVSGALYGGFLVKGWVPTFLPGCTIPAAIVFMYGKSTAAAITGGVISGIIQFPLGYFGSNLATKLGLPSISGNAVFGMALAGILIMELVRLLPWMKRIMEEHTRELAAMPAPPPLKEGELPPTVGTDTGWFLRRIFADYTEIYFYGNEIAGVCLVLGMLFSWVLNPAHTGYGGPNFMSAILAAQLMGSSLAIFFYYDKWQKYGWFNTFTASLAQGALVLTFGTSLPVILMGAVLSALIPPIMAFTVASKQPARYHSVVGGTCGMGIGIAVEGLLIKLALTVLPV